MNKNNSIRYSILLPLYLTSILILSAQVGINTKNPLGVFHVDARSTPDSTNPEAGIPNALQEEDDFIVTTNGNVGVGTISPTTKLDINGQIAIPYKPTTGTIIKDFMLQSDATGLASWAQSYSFPLYRTTIGVDRTKATPLQLLENVPNARTSGNGIGITLSTSYGLGIADLESTFVLSQPTFTILKDALYLVTVKQRTSDAANNDIAAYGDFLFAEMLDNTTYKEFIYKIPLREGTAGTTFLLKVENAPKVYRWYISLQNTPGINWFASIPLSAYVQFDVSYLYLRDFN